MKDYRTLEISGSREQMLATITEVERNLKDGWTRDRETEEANLSRSHLPPDGLRFCFNRRATETRPGALLVLTSDQNGGLKLSNIVPHDYGQLDYDEFNSILEEFVQKFLKSAAGKAGVEISTSTGEVSIDDWFSPETADKLRRLLKLTRGHLSHQSDDSLWKDFLISAHAENTAVHGDVLRRWLVDDARCDDYVADRLASEFQFSQELLERVGA